MNYILITFIITFLWGISPVLIKIIINKNIPGYIIILLQASVYFLSSIIYIIIYKRDSIYEDLIKNSKFIPYLAVIFFFTLYIANILYIYVVEKGKININIFSIILYTCAPVFTMLGSYLIYNEKISIQNLIGFLLICIGLICIFYPFK